MAVIPAKPNALRDGKFVRQQIDLSGVGHSGYWENLEQLESPLTVLSDKNLAQISPNENRESIKRQKYKSQEDKRVDNEEQVFEDFYPPPLSCKLGARLSQPLAYFIYEHC